MDDQISIKLWANVKRSVIWNRNQLDFIVTDQMIFPSPPGTGLKMISLFMTVT